MDFDRVKARTNDPDFQGYVNELLDGERLDGAAILGIAKKIGADGVEGLTSKQLETFIRYGLYPYNYVEECERCSFDVPWCEMYFALDDSYCSYCRHLIEKDI
ncbi:MAG: hypothetical protein H9W81_15220 [Enterococcus sp.]|nr:hypothetical protein [Enterococcus sp.]